MSWDPGQYGKFADDRLRPVIDLLARVGRLPDAGSPDIIDLGCGAGAAFEALRARWPGARITGLDSDRAMLEAARARHGSVHLVEADVRSWEPPGDVDLVFSNAVLHWLDGHEGLFPRLMGWLKPGGVLAVQMPVVWAEPLHVLLAEAADDPRWRDRLGDVPKPVRPLSMEAYAGLLSPLADAVDIWETRYLHRLQGENAVFEWIRGTSLKPYLDHLPSEESAAFAEGYAAALRSAYPVSDDGTTPLAFRRTFIVAAKSN